MKVKELIEQLKKLDKEKEVTIPDNDLQKGDLWKINSLEERGDNIVIWASDEKVKIKKKVVTEYYENDKLVKTVVKEVEEEPSTEPKKTMEEETKEIQDILDRLYPPPQTRKTPWIIPYQQYPYTTTQLIDIYYTSDGSLMNRYRTPNGHTYSVKIR